MDAVQEEPEDRTTTHPSLEDGSISPETADEYLNRWIDAAGFRSPACDFEIFLEK